MRVGARTLAPTLGPRVERLARDAQRATERGDDATDAGMRDQVADDLGALSGCASMALNHHVPLKGWLC